MKKEQNSLKSQPLGNQQDIKPKNQNAIETHRTNLMPSGELHSLIEWAATQLGLVIEVELGVADFQLIESLKYFVRDKKNQSAPGLLQLKKKLEALSSEQQFHVAHSFAIMLELINCCESAYRHVRILNEPEVFPDGADSLCLQKNPPQEVFHVLTAHPTESRNPQVLYFFEKIQNILIARLNSPRKTQASLLFALLKQAWGLPMSKQRKPSVMDEADYIYSLALRKDIIDMYVANERDGKPLFVRTWVGGDKDGHPFVDEKTMLGSLQKSRTELYRWISGELDVFATELNLGCLQSKQKQGRAAIQALQAQTKALRKTLVNLKKLKDSDSLSIEGFKVQFRELSLQHSKHTGFEHEALQKISSLIRIFPAFVVPLELREDSAIIREAAQSKSPQQFNICRMLHSLNKLCPDGSIKNYAKVIILSQCESLQDFEAGVSLVQQECQGRLPVAPLFESAASLKKSEFIINEFLKSKVNRGLVEKQWSSKLEVMLGYSDSAKENGSLPSRFLIQTAVQRLEALILKEGFTPLFFHGFGGSIERGGGAIQEQLQWWPQSAMQNAKMTIQGETIHRSYSSPVILQKQLYLINEKYSEFSINGNIACENNPHHQSLLFEMNEKITKSYKTLLNDPEFLMLIESATPYTFLKKLRFGSRPSKRQGPINLKGLRAIPWVFCWTQTRCLFPTWWGAGSFWKNLNPDEKQAYRKAYLESPLLQSSIKALGFTLKKVELEIFFLYIKNSSLSLDQIKKFEDLFSQEYSNAIKFIKEITEEQNLLWFRPYLEASIELRSPLIHPLNALQIIAMQTKNVKLLRESVTGISSGMLTTG